jgi:glycosyltransferase involved in cell wall biosynthesis
MFLEIYTVLVALYWIALTFYLLVNGRKIKHLSAINVNQTTTPSVAIIIAVRNEEAELKNALTSVCHLAYNNYKIIVVNDRSTDNSGKILAELQATFSNIKVVNIEILPQGWLGKNNALYTGYISSEEDYLLFTDADVVFKKDVLAKAMSFCLQNDLDHLTILPEITTRSVVLKSIISTFVIILTAIQRPWAAKIKTSNASMGVGAFNLVKREAYIHAGTHKAIAMRPDDDLRLAAFIKRTGGTADVLYGTNEIQVEWYKTVKEFINGLMKNAFSGFDYNVIKVIVGVTGMLLFFVLPLPLILIFGNGWERILAICMLLSQLLLYWKMPGSKTKWWYGLLNIYGGIIVTYTIAKAAIINLRNGGIYWRETFYSLKELRKAKKLP